MASPSSSGIKELLFHGPTALLFASLAACDPAVSDGEERSGEISVAEGAAIETPLNLSLDSASFPELNQPATNEEFGIQAHFPEASVVCQARSGDHPVGFSTDLDRISDCDNPRGDRLVRIVGVQASYNSSFRTSADDQLPCAPGSAPPYMMLDFREFAFQAMDSVSCMSRDKEGQIWVVVAALGGPLDHNEPPDPPTTHRVIYWTKLGTHAAHLREDLALYREFLRRLRFVSLD